MAQPVGGSFFGDKKTRSPFAPFKRGDSRDMQIPESPPPGADRPDTAQDSFAETTRNQSESRDRESFGIAGAATSPPESQPLPAATNGAAPQEIQAAPFPGVAPIPTAEVRQMIKVSCKTGVLTGQQPTRVDSEGFSERPQTIDEITRAQREAAGYDALNSIEHSN